MRHFDALRRTALATICSVAMVCSSLAPMAVQASAATYVEIWNNSLAVPAYVTLNADHATDDAWGNTVRYDAESNTLYLTNAELYSNAWNTDTICGKGGDLTIVLSGTNTVTNDNQYKVDETPNWNGYNDGIYVAGTLVIKGDGTLNVISNEGVGINVTGAVTVTGTTAKDLDDSIEAKDDYIKYAPKVYVNANGSAGISAGDTVTSTKGATLEVDGYAYNGTSGAENIYAEKGIITSNCSADVTVNNATLKVKGYNYGVYTTKCGDLDIMCDPELDSSTVEIQSMHVEWDDSNNVWKNASGSYAVRLGSDNNHYYSDGDGQHQFWNYGYPSIKDASEVTIIGGIDCNSNSLSISSTKLDQDLKDQGVTKVWVDVETGETRDKAEAVDDSPFETETLNQRGTKTLNNVKTLFRIHTKDSRYAPAKASTWTEGHHCNHVYEWEVYQQATATNDGIMRYRCKYCGDVQYEVPVTAYYMFNKNTQEAILKAEQGATVTTETALFISFHDMVQKALEQRPDVTLVVDYRNDGKNYEMTIPAGSAEQLDTLFGDSQFAGFLYLGGTYATTELPEDWEFTTVPASVVWFGATNAH